MGYALIKINTSDHMQLCREPSLWSWAMLCGSVAIGFGAAIYGTDCFLLKLMYISGTIYTGLLWMEGWEECDLDKTNNEVKISHKSIFMKFFLPFCQHKIVVMNLDNIVGVRVEEEEVRYLGKSHIVVFLLDTGITIGATQSYTFGCSKEHYEVADTLRKFLQLDEQAHEVQDTNACLGNGSSSEDSFEQIYQEDVEPN